MNAQDRTLCTRARDSVSPSASDTDLTTRCFALTIAWLTCLHMRYWTLFTDWLNRSNPRHYSSLTPCLAVLHVLYCVFITTCWTRQHASHCVLHTSYSVDPPLRRWALLTASLFLFPTRCGHLSACFICLSRYHGASHPIRLPPIYLVVPICASPIAWLN